MSLTLAATRRSTTWWAWIAAAVGGTGGILVSWLVASHSLIGARWHFVALIALWVPAWLVGVWGVRRLPTRGALVTMLVLAALLRLAAATGTVSISNDAARYAWDAHVQLSGTDPYRYPPVAPQVAHLHTRGFSPSVLNHKRDRTVYPAVAEAWFVVVEVSASVLTGHGWDGGGAGFRPWQLAGGLVDDLATVLMILLLRAQRRDPRLAAWYALCPVAVIEFAGNGHVDGVGLALLLGALLALRRDRPALAGILIGAATMVKLYPGAALVAGWRQGRWRMALPAVAVMAISETPHVVAVGTRVLGYLPTYLSKEQYTLLTLLHLPTQAVTVVAIACVLAAITVVFLRPMPPEVGLALILTVLIMVTAPVQPWYAVAIAGIAVAAGTPLLLTVPLAGEAYYAAVILDAHHQVAVGRLAYGIPLAAFVLARLVVWRSRAASRSDTGADEAGRPLLVWPDRATAKGYR
jgi:Glycosyltransferase family 87